MGYVVSTLTPALLAIQSRLLCSPQRLLLRRRVPGANLASVDAPPFHQSLVV